MNTEFTLVSGTSKARAAEAVRDAGFEVTTGPIRLAYPFTLAVSADHRAAEQAWQIVRSIDPCSGRIVGPADRARSTHTA